MFLAQTLSRWWVGFDVGGEFPSWSSGDLERLFRARFSIIANLMGPGAVGIEWSGEAGTLNIYSLEGNPYDEGPDTEDIWE